ncbi:AAA family ATPase [uncultured Croceitalea sp.]|uniref:AAA family ATPase n=1 Tax=uncultured Croceitalea sp. TaxID=1798908 RepID=UPI00330583B2
MKLLIFGASGSGTTTLSKEVSLKTGFKNLDVDDYYWKHTSPPYQEKVPLEIRNRNLTKDFKALDNVIVCGSMVSWGTYWSTAFDLVVFIYLDPEIRITRLQQREVKRYGNKLVRDKEIQQNSKAFIDWAKKYDDPDFMGRSLKVHKDWIAPLKCPVLHLDGALGLAEKTALVYSEIQNRIL